MKRIMIIAGIVALATGAGAAKAADAWKLSCEDDPIEDTRDCYLRGDGMTVIGIAFADGRTHEFVTAGYDKYPGSELVFRIDRNEPIRWPDREITGRSAEVIERMTTGKKIAARWTVWPYGTVETRTMSLAGFNAKLQEMRKRLAEYAPAS